MRTLYANGCSFTLGDELNHPEVERFPSIIAHTRNMFVTNEARCGAGNEEICRKTMNYLMEYIDFGAPLCSNISTFNEKSKENYILLEQINNKKKLYLPLDKNIKLKSCLIKNDLININLLSKVIFDN